MAAYTKAQLAQLRICDHPHHLQIDEVGIGTDGTHLTSCPLHSTFNPAWVLHDRLLQIARVSEIAAIFMDVHLERQAQDAQWGGAEHDDTLDATDWSILIERHLTAGFDEADKHLGPKWRARFVKIAALAIAAVESIDRQIDRQDVCVMCHRPRAGRDVIPGADGSFVHDECSK